MTDLLSIEAGKIEIREPGGSIRFTTDEPMFHVTDSVNGSQAITFPFAPSTSAWVRNTSYQIATGLAPEATHVFGVLQTTGDTYGRLPGGTWFDAGGTYMHRQHWYKANNEGTWGEASYLLSVYYYTFRLASGTLFLDEVAIRGSFVTGGLQSIIPTSLSNFTLSYKLKVGLFT